MRFKVFVRILGRQHNRAPATARIFATRLHVRKLPPVDDTATHRYIYTHAEIRNARIWKMRNFPKNTTYTRNFTVQFGQYKKTTKATPAVQKGH